MSKEIDRSSIDALVAARSEAVLYYNGMNAAMSRAKRFEEHLARLIKGWKDYSSPEEATGDDMALGEYTNWLQWFNKEFAAAEKSLEELGVKDDARG